MIVNYDCAIITIVNYDCKTFIVQTTGASLTIVILVIVIFLNTGHRAAI
jgi:hypothetical protein